MHNDIFICFDFGTRNIGVAVGQKITKTASPQPIIRAKNGIPNWHEVDKLIKKWNPNALVVGVPVNLKGEEYATTHAARAFIASLRDRYDLPVYEAEERLTTKAARSEIYERGGYKALQNEPIDSIAAKLILEGWFEQ